jgi:acyl carrier protein
MGLVKSWQFRKGQMQMDQTDAIYEDVKDILVDTLGVEPEEVIPSASFFDDLGGESIDVLDLSFRCEKQFGTTIRFQELFDSRRIGPDGTLSQAALKELQEQFPFLDLAHLQSEETKRATSLFTVNTIVRFVKHVLAQNDTPVRGADLEETPQQKQQVKRSS